MKKPKRGPVPNPIKVGIQKKPPENGPSKHRDFTGGPEKTAPVTMPKNAPERKPDPSFPKIPEGRFGRPIDKKSAL